MRETLIIKTPVIKQKTVSSFLFSEFGTPLKLNTETDISIDSMREKSGKYEYDYTFLEDGINAIIKKDGEEILKSGFPVKGRSYNVFGENHIGLFSAAVYFMHDKLVDTISAPAFNPNSRKFMHIGMKSISKLSLKYRDEIIPCTKASFSINNSPGGTLWISRKGVLLKDEERGGELQIKLIKPGSLNSSD